MTALTQRLHPLHEIANGALEGDDRVARRKIGEAPAHGVDLGAHGAKIGRDTRIGSLAARLVELERERPNVVEQQLRERRRRVPAGRGRRVRPLTRSLTTRDALPRGERLGVRDRRRTRARGGA